MKIIGCVSLKRIPILLTVLVITVVGLSLISVPVAAARVGTCETTKSYSTDIAFQSCVVSGGYVYCVGGYNNFIISGAVYYAKLSSAGVGTWKLSSANPYPINLDGESCVVSGGYVFCVGGYTGVSPYFTNAVYFAKLSSAGVGTWNPTTSYPTIIGFQSCLVSGGYVYCVGGRTDVSPYIINAVYYAKLSSTGVGTWMSTTIYPTTIDSQSCVVSGGYVYCVAGFPGVAADTNAVYFAKLSSSGVGTWMSTTIYPTGINAQSCVVSGGYVYCVAGFPGGAADASAVYFAKLSSSGVGTWREATNSYPTTIEALSCVVSGGNIYCVGGSLNGGPGTSAVHFAKLSSSGVGTWRSTTAYPIATDDQSCVVSGKHAYCVGGETSVSPYVTSAVYFASV